MEDLTSQESMKRKYKVNFLLLLFGRSVSNLSAAIFGFALSLYVLDLTGSAVAFSLVLSFAFLPLVFVSFLGGALVDKSNKKKVIVLADMLSGCIVMLILVLFHYFPKNIGVFIVYTLILSTLQAFFNLAINASVPNLVGEDKVTQANSTLQAIGAITNIVGPILGAVFYKHFGLQFLLLLNGISLLIAGFSSLYLKYEYNPADNKIRSTYWEDIKVTFTYLNTRKVLGFFFIFAVIVNFMFNSLMFLVLPYINYNVIKISGLQLSLIQAAGALGVIISAFIISGFADQTFLLRRFFSFFRIQAVLILLWIFPLLPMFVGANKWPITILFTFLLIVYGGINTAQNIPMISYFQLQIPEELRARVFGVFSAALFGSTPLGLWVYGILLAKIPWFYIPLMSGIFMIILGILFAGHRYFKEFILGLNSVKS